MRGLLSRPPPSAHFSTLRPAADPRTGAASVPRHGLLESPRDRRGLLFGILESVGGFLGFGNDQAHPGDPQDTGSGAPSTPGSHGPTSVQSPVDQPSPPAHAPPVSYPAPGGGGGQGDKPTSSAPMPPASVSPASSGSAGTEPGTATHSTSPPPDAMNVVPSVSTAQPPRESQSVTDIHGGLATSHTGWRPMSGSLSPAPSPTHPPTQSPTLAEHAKRFPLAAAAAIGAVLGFVIVSALFWVVWLALRKRRRAYPEFASVHPKLASVPESVGADGNPFAHPRDEKEDDPFDAALCRASSARSLASTLSV